MKHAVIIPDSFKGSMSAMQVADIIKKSINKYFVDAKTTVLPIADGGEGTVDTFLAALGGEKIYADVKNPYLEPMNAYYGGLHGGKTAVVEMAACAGLPLVEGRANPMLTSTYGVGELILAAVENGYTDIIVGLGGSCTNDFGVGMACGLGARFYNENNEEFLPTGGTLSLVSKIDLTKSKRLLKGVTIRAMCDVENPLCGENGATYIFAPQKGATPELLAQLDSGMHHIGSLVTDSFGIDTINMPRAGAAGGCGGGIHALLGGVLKSGIDSILDIVDFDKVIADADIIFSGEGRIDGQSVQGKAISGIALRAKKQNKPLVVIVGDAVDPLDEIYSMGVTAVFSINRMAMDFSKAKLRCEKDLENTADSIMRLLKSMTLLY